MIRDDRVFADLREIHRRADRLITERLELVREVEQLRRDLTKAREENERLRALLDIEARELDGRPIGED